MILGWDHMEDSGRQGDGISLEQDYIWRREEMERDRLEAERIRQAGYQLAMGNKEFELSLQDALLSDWEQDQADSERGENGL